MHREAHALHTGTASNVETTLLRAIGESSYTRAYAQHAMANSEAKLLEIFKNPEHRLPAKAVLVSASKAIVRLARTSAALESAAKVSQTAALRRFHEKDADYFAVTTDLGAVESTLGSMIAALGATREQLGRQMQGNTTLSDEVQRLTYSVAEGEGGIHMLVEELQALERAHTAMRADLNQTTCRADALCEQVRWLSDKVLRSDNHVRVLESELQETEGDIEGIETSSTFSVTSLLTRLSGEREQMDRERCRMQLDLDRLTKMMADECSEHTTTRIRLDASAAEVKRLTSLYVVAEGKWQEQVMALEAEIQGVAETHAHLKAEHGEAVGQLAELTERLEVQRLAAEEKASTQAAIWRQKEAYLTKREAELARDLERARTAATETEAELSQRLDRERLRAADQAISLDQSLQQRLAAALRARIKETAWRRREDALNKRLEAMRDAASATEEGHAQEDERRRAEAAEREGRLNAALEQERRATAERVAELQQRGEDERRMADAKEETKDAARRRVELELNHVLESVRTAAAATEARLHSALEHQRAEAKETEAQLTQELERERIAAARQAEELMRRLEAQELTAETMKQELHASLKEQRLAAKATEASLNRRLDGVRTAAAACEAELARDLQRQRGMAAERESDLVERLELERRTTVVKMQELTQTFETHRLEAAATQAELKASLEERHLAAESTERELRTALEDTREEAEETELRLTEAVENTDANARQQVATLSRQVLELQTQQMLDVGELNGEISRERDEKQSLEDKLLATAQKLHGTKKEADNLEARRSEAVQRELALARQLKDAHRRIEEVTGLLAAERHKRQRVQANLTLEIEQVNQAWRDAAANAVK